MEVAVSSTPHALQFVWIRSGFQKTPRGFHLPSEPIEGTEGVAKMLDLFHSSFP